MDDLTISDAPIPADQWLRLTVDALKDLGGALQMVPGAKLRQRMKVASANGGDWRGAEVGCRRTCASDRSSIFQAGRTGRRCCRYPSRGQRYGCRTTRRKHAAIIRLFGRPFGQGHLETCTHGKPSTRRHRGRRAFRCTVQRSPSKERGLVRFQGVGVQARSTPWVSWSTVVAETEIYIPLSRWFPLRRQTLSGSQVQPG